MASDYVVGLYEGVSLFEAIKAPRGSIEFTNTSGQFRLAAGPSSATAWTFTTWVKITNDTNFYALWLSLQGASSTYLETGFDITGNAFEVNDLSTERAVGVTATVGTWYFTSISMGASGAVTMFTGPEGGKLTKYTTTLTNLSLPLADALLGGELSYEHLDGAMAQTRFWNAVLSDAEILAEFYSDAPVRTSNIGGHWKLENTTSKLTDSSGASNTLTNPSGTGTWAYLAGPAIGPAPFGAPFENVAISETIDAVHTSSGGSSYTGNVSETVTVSESLAALDAATVGLAETDSLSESIGSIRGAIAGLAETVTLSESTAAAYAAVVPTPETVTLSEALGTQSNEASGLAETVTLSESMSGGSAFTAGTSETVTVSESTSAVYAATAATSETVSVGESSGSQAVMASGLSETVALSESLAGGSAFAASLGETVTDSEGGAFTYSAIVAPAETVTNSESVTGIQGGGGGGTAYTGDVNETVTSSETLGVAYASAIAVAELIPLPLPIMSELGTTDLHLVAEDRTPGSNWVSRVGGFTATLNGSLTKQTEAGIARDGVTGFGTSNYFSLAANAAHEFTESSSLTYEFVIRMGAAGGVLFGRYAAPYAGSYDISAYSASAGLGIYNDDGSAFYAVAVGYTALVNNSYYLVTVVLDGVGDQFAVYINGTLDVSETSILPSITNGSPGPFFIGNSYGNDQPFDGSIVEVVRHRAALNATEVRDRYRRDVVAASIVSTASPSETVSVSEATAAAYGAKPSVAETLSISDATTLAQVLAQGLTETVSVAESSAALAGFVRGIAETVSFSEAFASSIVQSAALAETVTLAELVGLSQVLANGLAESVALAEAMIGYIPRVLVTELGEPTAVKTGATTVAPVVSVETDSPAAVKTGSTTLLGLP